MTIIARSDFEPNNLKDLVSYIKGRSAKTTMGNAGVGSASHLCGMLLMSETKLEFTTVPYRGTAPVMNDLIGKQIDTELRPGDQHHRPDPRQAGEGLCGHHQGAAEVAARYADRRRGRSQRL